jgi:hypothetical protein
VRLPVVVRRVAPGVTGLVPTGWVASSAALGTVVVPGEYTVPGVVPMGAVPAGVVIAPLLMLLLGTAPLVVPTWPGATVPLFMGAVAAPGATGTVWAKAVVLKPSPSKAAKANAVVFIREFRISKGQKNVLPGGLG